MVLGLEACQCADQPDGDSEQARLTGHLEHQVLVRNRGGVEVRERDLVLRVVLADEVQDDGAGLPDGEVVVGMVDKGGHAAVGVEVGVRRLLVFACLLSALPCLPYSDGEREMDIIPVLISMKMVLYSSPSSSKTITTFHGFGPPLCE